MSTFQFRSRVTSSRDDNFIPTVRRTSDISESFSKCWLLNFSSDELEEQRDRQRPLSQA
jgi:hypothetical protein